MTLRHKQEVTSASSQAEKDLLRRCVKGDQKAQMALYDQCYGLLMGMCRVYYRNREDCALHVNTAFMKILSRLQEFRDEGSFEGWCRSIMRNVLIDEWRRDKKFKEMFSDNAMPEKADLSDAAYNKAESVLEDEDVREILFQLPEATRLVFNLFALEGYSHAEIAGIARISEGTSRWHVNEARKKLKELIEKKLE